MSRHVVSMTIDDVDHYSPEEKARIIASYPAHEREARAKGIPTMGSGKIFPVEESLITCAPFAIPAHWAQIIGLDFGVDHPFAASRLAWDRDADCIYLTHTFRQRGEHVDGVWTGNPAFHATTLRGWGKWIPVAWPHDGLEQDRQSGEQLASIYKSHDLNMLPERATHAEGGNGVEAGIMDMLERMQTNRFKVFANNSEWFEEFRMYHRKDGKIVKLRDDLISSTRYAVMMLRFAEVQPSSVEERQDRIQSGAWLGM
jgi:hypothetical protein